MAGPQFHRLDHWAKAKGRGHRSKPKRKKLEPYLEAIYQKGSEKKNVQQDEMGQGEAVSSYAQAEDLSGGYGPDGLSLDE